MTGINEPTRDTNDRFCETGGLPASMCAHCKKLDLPKPTDGVAFRRIIRAAFAGVCVLDEDHVIEEGSEIGYAVYSTAPGTDIGWACFRCTAAVRGKPARRTGVRDG